MRVSIYFHSTPVYIYRLPIAAEKSQSHTQRCFVFPIQLRQWVQEARNCSFFSLIVGKYCSRQQLEGSGECWLTFECTVVRSHSKDTQAASAAVYVTLRNTSRSVVTLHNTSYTATYLY